MATYYKYVERNAKDRINWNEVGKSVSDMLNEEAKVRIDKKAEIDENSRQFGIELANSPVGDYDHGNNFINEYTTNMSEYRRMQDNLLKTGQLSLGEYTRNRQNNTDGTKLTFDLATAYQEAYTEKMDRWENGESDYEEVWKMESVEGLANLRNTGSFINPTNGVISLATRTEDGGLDINNTLTAAEMYGNIKKNYNRYDVNKAVAEEVGFLGEVIEADLVKALRAGDVNTIQEIADKKLSPAYTQWEDDTVSSMMVNKRHISSALTTYKLQTDNGEFYTFTYNEDEFKNDKSGRLIYLDRSVDANGVPVFKPEQEEIVEDFFRNRIRSQIGRKESIQSAGMKQYAPQKTGGGLTKNQKQTALTNMAKLAYSLDTEDVLEAINSLEALNPGLDIDVQGNTVVMTQGGVTRTVNMKEIKTVDSFLTSHGNFILGKERQIDDINDLVAAGGFVPEGSTLRSVKEGVDFNVTGTGVADTLETFDESFIRTEGNKFDGSKILEYASETKVSNADEDKAVVEFQSMVDALPHTKGIIVRDFNIGADFGVMVEIDGKQYEINLEKPTKVIEQFNAARDAVIMYSLSRDSILKDEKEKEKYVKVNKGKAKPKEETEEDTGQENLSPTNPTGVGSQY